ncbi:MAG TPA: hypothetical protein PLM62_21575, partial [Zoogloea sp.]|nr:hypothetical protein [Zoogloea sp.]
GNNQAVDVLWRNTSMPGQVFVGLPSSRRRHRLPGGYHPSVEPSPTTDACPSGPLEGEEDLLVQGHRRSNASDVFGVFIVNQWGGLGRGFLHDPTPDLVNKAEQVHKEGKNQARPRFGAGFPALDVLRRDGMGRFMK